MKIKKGFKKYANGVVTFDTSAIAFIATTNEEIEQALKKEVPYYAKSGKIFCKKCDQDLNYIYPIITLCDCLKEDIYE